MDIYCCCLPDQWMRPVVNLHNEEEAHDHGRRDCPHLLKKTRWKNVIRSHSNNTWRIPYILAYKSNWKNKSKNMSKAFFHLLKPSKCSNSQFINVLDLIKFDPRISRIEKKSSKNCPKFLDLYPSIYGNLNINEKVMYLKSYITNLNKIMLNV